MMYGDDGQWWVWVPMMLAMIAVLGAIAWAVIRLAGTQGAAVPRGADARQILDARLARGEIDISEYEALSKALESRGGQGP